MDLKHRRRFNELVLIRRFNEELRRKRMITGGQPMEKEKECFDTFLEIYKNKLTDSECFEEIKKHVSDKIWYHSCLCRTKQTAKSLYELLEQPKDKQKLEQMDCIYELNPTMFGIRVGTQNKASCTLADQSNCSDKCNVNKTCSSSGPSKRHERFADWLLGYKTGQVIVSHGKFIRNVLQILQKKRTAEDGINIKIFTGIPKTFLKDCNEINWNYKGTDYKGGTYVTINHGDDISKNDWYDLIGNGAIVKFEKAGETTVLVRHFPSAANYIQERNRGTKPRDSPLLGKEPCLNGGRKPKKKAHKKRKKKRVKI